MPQASLRSVLCRLDRVVFTWRASITTTRKPSARSPAVSHEVRLPVSSATLINVLGQASYRSGDRLDLGGNFTFKAYLALLIDNDSDDDRRPTSIPI